MSQISKIEISTYFYIMLVLYAKIHGKEHTECIELPIDATIGDLKKSIAPIHPHFVIIEGCEELPCNTPVHSTNITNNSTIGVFIQEFAYVYFSLMPTSFSIYPLTKNADGKYYNPDPTKMCAYESAWVETRSLLTPDLITREFCSAIFEDMFAGVQKILTKDFGTLHTQTLVILG